MTDCEVLQRYIELVPFLGAVLGTGCEVVVHDISSPEHSLVAICNSISGRKPGDPITDLGQDLIQRGAHSDADYLANYVGQSQNHKFLSFTYYIKNDGRLIGLLCVNKDITILQETNSSLCALLRQFNLFIPQDSEFIENLDNPMANIMHTRIEEIIAQSGQMPSRMNLAEKVKVVHRMREDGVTMMKGAVPEIASQLGVSVPTVYRYLNRESEE